MAMQDYIRSRSLPVSCGCWIWIGCESQKGYGQIMKFGFRAAHRLSYRAFNGDIPSGGLVLHKCDVPQCVNPDHLEVGTAAENSQQMIDRGRSGRGRSGLSGKDNPASKLSEAEVQAIRLDPRPARAVGAEYGVSKTMVLFIRQRKFWRHI